jgi:hypothetical protein
VSGGAAEVPVIDQERSGKTKQRLDWQEDDLPAAWNGPALQQLGTAPAPG